MAIEEETVTAGSPSIEELRAFLRLPTIERRRILEEQASRLLSHYQEDDARRDREEWQGGDIVEY